MGEAVDGATSIWDVNGDGFDLQIIFRLAESS